MQLALKSNPRRSRISLTALIDIVFILLLFFMLSSQFTHWQSQNLPLAQSNVQQVEILPQTLTLDANGTLLDGSHTVALAGDCSPATGSLAGLSHWLERERPLILQPLGAATVQQMLSALDCLKRAGAERVTLAEARTTSQAPASPAKAQALPQAAATANQGAK